VAEAVALAGGTLVRMPPALAAAALEDCAASYGASVLDLTVSLLPRSNPRT
jgi:hypothetical protein